MSSHTSHHHHQRPEPRRGGKRRAADAAKTQLPGEASAAAPPAPAGATSTTAGPTSASAPPPVTAAAAPGARLAGAIPAPTTAAPSAGWGVLLRVVWMGLGNLALAGLAVTITQAGGRFTFRDGLYAVLIVALAGVRWLDITRYGGTTADGRPATMRDLRRYVVLLVVVAAGLLVACHLAGRWLAGLPAT